tara:strand:- start:2553 stop:3557 length:1005 start_codon:yes stop_codon:yes gene_type:complete
MIVGGGWMGCHIAYVLVKKGYHVKLFERKKIFNGMSGSNTNRLHMGYHYPRSYQTRIQSMMGYKKFKKIYPFLSKQIKNNLIYIIKGQSLIDYNTYKKVMRSSNLEINETKFFRKELSNYEGIIKVNETQILQNSAKKFFKSKLKKNIIENKKVTPKEIKFSKKIEFENNIYDFLIDCTAGHLFKKKVFDISYEPRVTWIYKSNLKSFALMAMDGEFYNIFPYDKKRYILGTPKYSKFKKFKNLNSAQNFLKKIKNKDVINRKILSENIVKKSFINFNSIFKYSGFFYSLTTIFNSNSDNRPTLVKKEKNIFHVLGGKIDTIFEAEKEILKKII